MDKHELDKKFINKVLDKGGVERDVFVKRYHSYIWAIINKKAGADQFPEFIKQDIYQYVFIKIFEEDGRVLRQYVEEYSIPFQNFLSIFVGSRILDYIRKDVKESEREVVLVNEEGENQAYETAESESSTPEEVLESIEFSSFLKHYENSLPEKEQAVFRLMIEGVASGEIAEELNCDIKIVYKLVFKIKQDLKKKVLKDVA